MSNNRIKPEDPDKTHIHKNTCKQSSGRCRCFILCINSGCVHWNKSEFSSKSGKYKKECQFEPEWVKLIFMCHQVGKREICRSGVLKRQAEEKNTYKNKSNANGTDENIFPGSFK